MKNIYTPVIGALILLGCQKALHQPSSSGQIQQTGYLTQIQAALKDSLFASDYARLDFTRAYQSRDTATAKNYLRVGITGQPMAKDFWVLQTDTSGRILQGRRVQAAKQAGGLFTGSLTVSRFNQRDSLYLQIINGQMAGAAGAVAVMEEPVGSQDLAPVVVTSYTYQGDAVMDWYLLSAFFDDGSGWMYAAASPGGNDGGGGSSVGTQVDETMQLQAEPTDDPLAVVSQYLACFGTLPATGASYQVSILSDIPVNGDPSAMFDWKTGSPGHSFIQLKETSGGATIQQNLGFYPTTGWKTIAGPTTSKTLDNAGHEFNAELTITVSAAQFQQALTKMQEISSRQYDLATFNCTDFALAVFNAANPEQLSVPQYTIPGNSQSSNTPQGLYNQIMLIQQTGNQAFGTATVPGVAGYAGGSHGPCK